MATNPGSSGRSLDGRALNDTMHGFVDDVAPDTRGDETTTAAAVGTNVLAVWDVDDFYIGCPVRVRVGVTATNPGQLTTIIAVDDEADPHPTITLANGLTTAVEAGDRIDVWDPDAAAPVEEWIATLIDSTDGSVTQHSIDHALIDELAQTGASVDSLRGASVSSDRDADSEWFVTKVLGRRPRGKTDGLPPTTSPLPVLSSAARAINVAVPKVANPDPTKVDVWMATSNPPPVTGDPTFTVDGDGASTTPVARVGGSAVAVGTTYYARTRARDGDGPGPVSAVASVTMAPLSDTDAPGAGGTDGAAPSSSPTPIVRGGIRLLFVEIPATGNADDTEVDVWVSTTNPPPVTGVPNFTLSGNGKRIGTTNTVSGATVAPDVTYYARTRARDADGPGPLSAVGSGQLGKINTPDIVAGAITASLLLAEDALIQALQAETITGIIVTSSTFQTNESGNRLVLRDDGDGGVLEGWLGTGAQVTPALANPRSDSNGRPGFEVSSGKKNSNSVEAYVGVYSGSSAEGSRAKLEGTHVEVGGNPSSNVQVGYFGKESRGLTYGDRSGTTDSSGQTSHAMPSGMTKLVGIVPTNSARYQPEQLSFSGGTLVLRWSRNDGAAAAGQAVGFNFWGVAE